MICIPGIISELTRQIASRKRLLRTEAKPKDLDWRECCKLKIKRQTWWPLQISEVASKNPGFWIPSKIRRQVMVEMKIVSDPLVLCSFLVWFRVSFCDCSRLMISATHRLTSEPVLESSTPEFVIFYNYSLHSKHESNDCIYMTSMTSDDPLTSANQSISVVEQTLRHVRVKRWRLSWRKREIRRVRLNKPTAASSNWTNAKCVKSIKGTHGLWSSRQWSRSRQSPSETVSIDTAFEVVLIS